MGRKNIVSTQSVRLTGGVYSPTMDVGFIECDTSSNPITIILPNILSSNADDIGYQLNIQDVSGNASNNNITIKPSKTEKINGKTMLVMSNDGEVVSGRPFGDFYWSLNSFSGGSSVSSNELIYRAILHKTKSGAPTANVIRNDYDSTPKYSEAFQSIGNLEINWSEIKAGFTLIKSFERILTYEGASINRMYIADAGIASEGTGYIKTFFGDASLSSYKFSAQLSAVLNGVNSWVEIISKKQ